MPPSAMSILDEDWRPVVGWEHLYEVSNQGRVRSLPRYIPAVNRNGTGRLNRCPGGVGNNSLANLRYGTRSENEADKLRRGRVRLSA